MLKQLGLIWILILVTLSAAGAASTLQVEVTPAWNGYFKPGKATELSIKLLAEHSGMHTVQINKLISKAPLSAGIPYTLALPYPADRHAEAQSIRAYSAVEPELDTEQKFNLTASNKPLIAIVSDQLP